MRTRQPDAAPRISRLSAADLTNLAIEAPDTPMHVGVLAILDGATLFDDAGRLRLAKVRGDIERQLDGVPVLRQLVHHPGPLAGSPLWIDDPAFRIEHHVGQVELAPPYDEPALLTRAESLMAPRLDRTHPMWRVWFITGMPDHQVAVLVTLHHAIADGLAAIQLLTTMLDRSASPDPTSAPWTAMPPPGWAELSRDNARVTFAAARRVFGTVKPSRLASTGNLALSFLTLSYAGRLTISVRADADRYPDLPVLLAAMAEEWHRLSRSVASTTVDARAAA